MLKIYKLFFLTFAFYLAFVIFSYNKLSGLKYSLSDANANDANVNINPQAPEKPTPAQVLQKFFSVPLKANNPTQSQTTVQKDEANVSEERKANPFYLLGAYPEVNSSYLNFFSYNKPNLGLINDDDYCEVVDRYNLDHPENVLAQKNFFTDFFETSLPRNDVMKKLGNITMKDISWIMPKAIAESRKYHLKPEINNFFMRQSSFHQFHKIGQNYLCATQMYNHIPGFGALVRKDTVLDMFNLYTDKYADRPQCFDKDKLFPSSYRLYVEEECNSFFSLVNSRAYKKSLEVEPVQYLVKIGRGSHKSEGVFLLDDDLSTYLKDQYDNGGRCGVEKHSLIAQSYVKDPLLLDLNNKFDFRIYMLIASTNPLIVYFHDGFLRVSVNTYEKSSKDRATHLTNTYLANQKIEEAKSEQKKINGMNEKELQDYILWSFERFQQYLLEDGRITDPQWLDNVLRPAFHKACIHLVRMTGDAFWKQSNVYQLQGLDFMLDAEMNLWFIESNPSPQLTGTSQNPLYQSVLMSLFDIQFAYYRSRMERVLDVVKRMDQAMKDNKTVDIEAWKAEYNAAVKNRLEPKYQLSKNNNFTLIMDENLPGADAYMGYISPECL